MVVSLSLFKLLWAHFVSICSINGEKDSNNQLAKHYDLLNNSISNIYWIFTCLTNPVQYTLCAIMIQKMEVR